MLEKAGRFIEVEQGPGERNSKYPFVFFSSQLSSIILDWPMIYHDAD